MSLDFCEAVGSEGGAHPLDQLFPSHRGKPVKKVRLVPAEKAFSFARKLQGTPATNRQPDHQASPGDGALTQLSSCRPGTRANSSVLLVTSRAP